MKSTHHCLLCLLLACLSTICTSYRSGLSLRDYHILTYADYLRSDAGLWRVVVDYMYSCDDIGKQQADEVLLRVPLRLYDRPNPAAGELITEEREETEAVVGVLKELNEACSEYQREATRRTICRVSQTCSFILT